MTRLCLSPQVVENRAILVLVTQLYLSISMDVAEGLQETQAQAFKGKRLGTA